MCPCSYCQRMSGPMRGCPCEMCRRAVEQASINRNLGALAMIGGDVRGYGAYQPWSPSMRGMANYGQRAGGCGCNGKR